MNNKEYKLRLLKSKLNKLKKVRRKNLYWLRMQQIKPEKYKDKKTINSLQLKIISINNTIRKVKNEIEEN